MKKRTFTRILVIGTACLVLGCGKKEESTQEAKEPETKISEEKEVEKEEETEYKTIGEESGDALRILLTNQTGGEIIGLSVKESAAKEATDNLLDEGMRIKEEETLCLYYTPEEGDSAEDSKTPVTYDLSLAYEDEHVVEITGLELDDMEEAELYFEDEVGYVTYKSADSGKEVSTKETALALKAQREAQAAAEKAKKEEAKKEEERKAAEQAKKEAEAAAAAQRLIACTRGMTSRA